MPVTGASPEGICGGGGGSPAQARIINSTMRSLSSRANTAIDCCHIGKKRRRGRKRRMMKQSIQKPHRLLAEQFAGEHIAGQTESEGEAQTGALRRLQRPVHQHQGQPVGLERQQCLRQRHELQQVAHDEAAPEHCVAWTRARFMDGPALQWPVRRQPALPAARRSAPFPVAPTGSLSSCSSSTSPLRSSAALGVANAAVNMPEASLLIARISPTGNPAGKCPPRPEVMSRSPTFTSALTGMFGSSSVSSDAAAARNRAQAAAFQRHRKGVGRVGDQQHPARRCSAGFPSPGP